MKICICVGTISGIGGIQRVITLFANELAKKHEVTISSYDTPEILSNSVYKLDKSINFVEFPKNKIASNILYRIVRKILSKIVRNDKYLEKIDFPKFMRKKLVTFFNQGDYDVVIGVAWYHSLLLAMVAPEIEAKTIGWQHNSYNAYFCTPKRYAWKKDGLFKKYLSNLDAYVVLNETAKEKVDANFGINSTVIYNPKSYVSKEKSDMKNKVFLAAGRMAYAKGFDTLIDAFRIFAQENSDWKLLLVGDGEELPAIKDKIKEYELEKRILTPGKTDDIKKYFLQSSVLLLPSRWEGMPMIVLESLEMGCPIVAFDIDAMGPLVTDGIEGLIVKNKQDANAYAQAMLKIAENQALRDQMHQAAIQKSRQFSVDKIVSKWEEILR
ncbi:glycosyltransferase family 4 protein [Ligilactobacillus salivarius]|uniref:glycosyltransferase family 4 protein n=1 Tax=Ligilactobacillus salivarius TaxID=1624 RepID=UPI0011CB4E1A|nr:glycosyltransferase family 4 protein [Ligilactobacillus salivarius]MBX0283279.1 glycosyltransferase family 4 protein [Ligilactobacillus salivarius]TXJ84629.1 glycosyltransferase family 4 protein [Ligilactobacillus salivarius]